jgi:hypothetical protein
MKLPQTKKFKTGDIVSPIIKGSDKTIYEVIPPVFDGELMIVKKINDRTNKGLTAYAFDFKLATEKEKIESRIRDIFMKNNESINSLKYKKDS